MNPNHINTSNKDFEQPVGILLDNLQSIEVDKRTMQQFHESKSKISKKKKKKTLKIESLQDLTVLQNNDNIVI